MRVAMHHGGHRITGVPWVAEGAMLPRGPHLHSDGIRGTRVTPAPGKERGLAGNLLIMAKGNTGPKTTKHNSEQCKECEEQPDALDGEGG